MSDSTKSGKKRVSVEILQAAGGYIKGSALDYFSEAMPTTSSTLSSARRLAGSAASAISSSRSVLPKVKGLKRQIGIREITNWFLNKESEYDVDFDALTTYDIDDENQAAEIAEVQISEAEQSANKIAKAVIESTHRNVESQIQGIANILEATERQTSTIAAGFDKTSELLGQILEVVTKNTASIIESNIAGTSASIKAMEESMVQSRRFSLDVYQKIVTENLRNSELGMAATLAKTMGSGGGIKALLSPDNIISMLFNGVVNKKAPNLKKNLRALDEVVGDTLLTSALRLGEKSGGFGPLGVLGRIFGIKSERKTADTSRSELELKSTPYDTISKEYLTSAIPGYLRKILVAVGGPDLVYDARSRSFRTEHAIHQEFRQVAAKDGSVYRAPPNVRDKLGNSEFQVALYDIVSTKLGSMTPGGDHRKALESFANPKEAERFVMNELSRYKLTHSQLSEAKHFARDMSKAFADPADMIKVGNQIAADNLQRNRMTSEYIRMADAYGVDLSGIEDSLQADEDTIMSRLGISLRENKRKRRNAPNGTLSEVNAANHVGSASSLTGVNYTNMALYNIYRRLNEGINTFVVGSNSESQNGPFKPMESMPAPSGYNAHGSNPTTGSQVSAGRSALSTFTRPSGEDNLLQNNIRGDGSQENLSRGDRFMRWGKKRGGALIHSLFSGSPDDVKQAFSGMLGDIVDVAKTKGRDRLSEFNRNAGNLTGKIKHQMFGTAYTRQEYDEYGNLIERNVASNEKGGIAGYIGSKAKPYIEKSKAGASKWLASVKEMFDFDKEEGVNGEMKTKQRRIMSLSIGAFAGSGLLGGPLGLLVGTIAGGALGMTGLGSKIKGILFGRDKKGKAKGILTRVGDAIVTPIKYQIGKTVSALGMGLKKNLLGPLSNIGHAIKDRISSSAEKHFGKAFGTAGKIVSGILTAPFKLMMAPFKTANRLVRGTAQAGGWGLGHALNGIARMIGAGATHVNEDGTTESFAEFEKKRVNKWKEEYNADRKNSKYKNYKTYKKWTEEEQARAAEEQSNFNDFISETVTDSQETQDDIKEGVDKIVGEIVPGSSFKVHDFTVCDKLDNIIELLSSAINAPIRRGADGTVVDVVPPSISQDPDFNQLTFDDIVSPKSEGLSAAEEIANKRDEDKETANSAVVAASVVSSNGGLNKDDVKSVSSVISEASRENPDKGRVLSKLGDTLSSNEEKTEVQEEKKSGIWEMLSGLMGGIGGALSNLPAILAAVAGIWMLFSNPEGLGSIISGIGKVVGRIGEGIGGILGWMSGTNKKDAVTTGVNAVTGLVDVQSNSVLDYVNPTASLYHNEVDGAGQQIVNKTATDAKNNVTWLEPAKQAWVGAQGRMYAKSDKYLGKAVGYETKANAAASAASELRAQGGFANNIKALGKDAQSKYNMSKANQQMDKALDAEAKGNKIAAGPKGSLLNTAAKIGTLTVASSAVGNAAGGIASWMGADEKTSATVNNIATSATSAGLTANMMKSAVTGKKSMVDTIMDLLKKMLNWLAKKFKADKALAKFASKIDGLCSKIYNATVGKITKKIEEKLVQVIAKAVGEQAATVVSLGIPILVGAVSGLASGFCGVEHLFGVLPGEADAGMTTISAIMSTAFGALEMVPGIGIGVAMIDVLDTILIGVLGCGLKQFLARGLYSFLGGEEAAAKLEAKQQKFSAEVDYYNQKYGTNLDEATFNDKVNSTSWWDKLWNGGMQYDDQGHLIFDEAGGNKPGGLKGVFVGENSYVKDANGNVVRTADGEAVVKKDAKGHVVKEDMKLGDHIGNFFHDVGSWFGGQTTYETDENGNAIVDENGEYVVKSQEGNIFQRIFQANPEEHKTSQSISNAISQARASATSMITSPIENVQSAIDAIDNDHYERDADGNPIEMIHTNDQSIDGAQDMYVKRGNISEYVKAAAHRVNSLATDPFKEVNESIDQYATKDASWKKDGYNSIGDYAQEQVNTADANLMEGYGKLANVTVDPNVQKSLEGAAAGLSTGVSDSVDAASDAIGGVFQKLRTRLKRFKGASIGGELDELDKPNNPLQKPARVNLGYEPYPSNFAGFKGHFHHGVDIVPSDGSGQSQVNSLYSGTVEQVVRNVPDSDHADPNGVYNGPNESGNMISIRRTDGSLVRYMHMKDGSIPSSLTPGSQVSTGTRIGDIGSTGRSTGNHLHMDIQSPSGSWIDPLKKGRSSRRRRSSAIGGSSYGSGKFTPRTTPPTTSDKYWIHTSGGGYNECITISGKSCLPNCVGYAWGRAYEILGARPDLSTNHAKEWYDYASKDARLDGPALGAVMCWKSGEYGHVAIVESIRMEHYDLIVTTSESCWSESGGTWFRRCEYSRSKGYKNGNILYPENQVGYTALGDGYEFQGFIVPNNAGEVEVNEQLSGSTSSPSQTSSTSETSNSVSFDMSNAPTDSPLTHAESNGQGNVFQAIADIASAAGAKFLNKLTPGFKLVDDGEESTEEGSEGSDGESAESTTEESKRSAPTAKSESSPSGTVQIPDEDSTFYLKDGTPVTRKLGSMQGHEQEYLSRSDPDWVKLNHGWNKDSKQGVIRENAIKYGRYRKQNKYGLSNIATIDDRILIATNQRIGSGANSISVNSGDHVDVELEDGSVWKAMIGDAKLNDITQYDPNSSEYRDLASKMKNEQINEWGHNNGVNTVEFIYDTPPVWKKSGDDDGNRYEQVRKIRKTGASYKATTSNGRGGIGGPVVRSLDYQPPKITTTMKNTSPNVDQVRPIIYVHGDRSGNKQESGYTSFNQSGGVVTDSKADKIVSLLSQVILELKNISTNTGESTEKLEDISKKNFVDQDLRNELNSVGSTIKTHNNKASVLPSHGANAVFAMARP